MIVSPYLILFLQPAITKSVIIGDLYVVGIAVAPHEAETELIIDANAMLALSIAVQCFQAITGRDEQVLQSGGDVKHGQLPFRRISQIRRRCALAFACIPEFFRAPVGEGFDHSDSLMWFVNNVTR
jgi:hypothetical protein